MKAKGKTKSNEEVQEEEEKKKGGLKTPICVPEKEKQTSLKEAKQKKKM